MLLGNIQPQDDLICNVELHFGITKQRFTLSLQILYCYLHLDRQSSECTLVVDRPVPRFLNCFVEVGEARPEGFKSKTRVSMWESNICK